MGTNIVELPIAINVLGALYQIEVKSMHDHGETDPKARTISIRAEDPIDIQIETFYHEVGHAIMFQIGTDELFSDRQQELLVQSFGIGWLSVVKHLKGVLPYAE